MIDHPIDDTTLRLRHDLVVDRVTFYGPGRPDDAPSPDVRVADVTAQALLEAILGGALVTVIARVVGIAAATVFPT